MTSIDKTGLNSSQNWTYKQPCLSFNVRLISLFQNALRWSLYSLPESAKERESISKFDSGFSDLKMILNLMRLPEKTHSFVHHGLLVKQTFKNLNFQWHQGKKIETRTLIQLLTHSSKMAERALSIAYRLIYYPQLLIQKYTPLNESKPIETKVIQLTQTSLSAVYKIGQLFQKNQFLICLIDLILTFSKIVLQIFEYKHIKLPIPLILTVQTIHSLFVLGKTIYLIR